LNQPTTQLDVITGAFSYSGAVIAQELRRAGHRLRTLTGHPGRAPAGTDIDVRPLDFTDPAGLTESLRGAHTLYNTYWVRFPHGRVDHEAAVANSRILFEAAARAGVQRIVHTSITNPSLNSPYPYFRGKAEVEQILAGTGVSCAILRPAILFGGDAMSGVLVNNIAWLLRRVPVFAIGGRGDYRVRAIHVDDLARLCVKVGADSETVTLDAVGPQSVTFREMVDAVRAAVGSRAVILGVPGPVLLAASRVLGAALRDTLLTREEYEAMADGLADSAAPSTGEIVFTDWVAEHGTELGRAYANELDRHFRPARTALARHH
jgi:nucleoside-diphosphate-sugar epimerase